MAKVAPEEIKASLRTIPDFPKPGINFIDITTLLQDGELFSRVIDALADYCRARGVQVIVAIDSRGFIFGGALADRLKLPFVPVRKKGKLPSLTLSAFYALEYGEACIEIHVDALAKGSRAIIIDDLLATGGTAAATAELVEKLGGEVAGLAFIIELGFLNGREKLAKYDVLSLTNYES